MYIYIYIVVHIRLFPARISANLGQGLGNKSDRLNILDNNTRPKFLSMCFPP